MKSVFADAGYWIALLNPRDNLLTREVRSPPLLAFYGYLRNRNIPAAPRFGALENGWEWTASIPSTCNSCSNQPPEGGAL